MEIGEERGKRGGSAMWRLLGQSIKKSKKITVAYKCAQSEHTSWSVGARVCLLVCR